MVEKDHINKVNLAPQKELGFCTYTQKLHHIHRGYMWPSEFDVQFENTMFFLMS